jgi:hypothetical protein
LPAAWGCSTLAAISFSERDTMRTILFSLAVASLVTSASAAPLLNQANSVVNPFIAENVKIVCETDGHCYRPPSRPKIARWVYGEDAFCGPYRGPGYYGRPNWRSCWWWSW